MNTIYKYVLPYEHTDSCVIQIKGLEKVLSVEEQRNEFVLYALVDTDRNVLYDVTVYIVGTGNPCRDNMRLNTFLGTIKCNDGDFMFHFFYNIK